MSKSGLSGSQARYDDIIQDEESLNMFLSKVRAFNRSLSSFIKDGSDFTLRLEVRGNCGELLHIRVYEDDIQRPKGSQKRIDKKKEC